MANLVHMEELRKIFDNVNEWLKFAEAKNFGLLSLCAAVMFGSTQIDFVDNSLIEKVGLYTFIPIATISFLCGLLSLFPIFSALQRNLYAKNWITSFSNFIEEEKKFDNIHFYGTLKDLNLNEFENSFSTKTGDTTSFTDYEKELAIQIIYNSQITWIKYQLFKISAFLFGLSIITFVVFYAIISLALKITAIIN